MPRTRNSDADSDSECPADEEDVFDNRSAIDEDLANQRGAAPEKDFVVDNEQTAHSKDPVVDDLNDDDSCIWFTSIKSGTGN